MDKPFFSGAKRSAIGEAVLVVASVVLVGALAGCGAQGSRTGPSTEPDPRARNGQIAFSRLDEEGQSGVFVVEADGTGLERLENVPVGKSPDSSPAWSPDRERLAFGGDSGGFNVDIYATKADGRSGPERVTRGPTLDSGPSWSPDGARIAFSAVDVSRRFSSASASAGSVQESSDKSGIYTVGSDGTGPRRLTRGAGDERPAWSPDGTKIAFGRLTEASGRICVVGPDGERLEELTDPPRATSTAIPPGPRAAKRSPSRGPRRAGPTCS